MKGITAGVVGGSSPHTRGAPLKACAPPSVDADHPRIRGEHIDTDRPGAAGTGSSPHTRGAPDRGKA